MAKQQTSTDRIRNAMSRKRTVKLGHVSQCNSAERKSQVSRRLKRGTETQEPVKVQAPILSKLTMHNFQAHLATCLELHPGVNVITGQSDSGKTTARRALSWIAANRPSGLETFLTTGADPSTGLDAIVSFADGISVVRAQSKKSNRYEILQPGKDPQQFLAVGSTVPDQVKDVMRMSDVNIQSQFDTHYMLSISPGERGRMFNEVTGLDLIDSLFQHINSVAARAKTSEALASDDLAKFRAEIAGLAFLDDARALLDTAKNCAEKADVLDSERNELSKLIMHGFHIQAQIEELKPVLQVELELFAAENALSLAASSKLEFEELASANRQVSAMAEARKQLDAILSTEPDIAAIEVLLGQAEAVQDQGAELGHFITAMEYLSMELTKATDYVTDLSRELAGALTKYGICPLCNQRIPAHMTFDF